MYRHHEESIKNLVTYFQNREEVIALVLGGSVAKGMERPDSDLDAMLIVTDAYYEKRKQDGTTAECIFGFCTYEGGYFDIKYMTKSYIEAAARKGSEPTRNSFTGSRVLFTKDPEIPGIISRIPVFQEQEMADKQLSFFSNLQLNYHYFWKDCRPEGYMKIHTAGEIIYSIYRLILQENRILFPCNRRLEEAVAAAPEKPDRIVEKCREFLTTFSDSLLDEIYSSFLEFTSYQAPEEPSVCQTRYVLDYEQWWLYPRPNISEW